MKQFLEWLNMGGYALYVWPAYSLAGVVLVMNLFGLKWKRRQTWQKLHYWFKR